MTRLKLATGFILFQAALAFAQNSNSPATTLPKKTLAETLGLPNTTPNTPPSPTAGTLVVEEKTIELKSTPSEYPQRNTRSISLGINFVNSQWSEFGSQLDNGSLGFEVSSSRTVFEGFQAGLGMGWFSGVPNTSASQNQYYAFYVSGRTNWEIMDSKVTPTAGLDLELGSYRVWAVDSESESNITFSKLGAGTLLGFVPHVGVRFQLSHHSFMDLNLGYHGYVDVPQSKLGGWSLGLNLGLKR